MPSTPSSMQADVVVIGAGIAGASAAAALGEHGTVTLLEAEPHPGYHTTGRSAAFFAESYGGDTIRPLTAASRRFFESPPAGFSDRALIAPRGCLHVFQAADAERARAAASRLASTIGGLHLIEAQEVLDRVPVLRLEGVAGAIDDPACRDLDVAAIHQGFLDRHRRSGGRLLCNAPVTALSRHGARWHIETPAGRFEAGIVVNAAGAWADEIAALAGAAPVGLQPMRRTVILFRPSGVEIDDRWPLTLDFNERFYFKPETGRILASPADETPSPACDAQPEEMDIAVTVDRLERATRLDVPRIESKWAGLRTFAPDRTPVVGPDPIVPGFIWCAGQGGYGIQTAPAIAALTAAAALRRAVPDGLVACGVRPEIYSPARFVETAAIS